MNASDDQYRVDNEELHNVRAPYCCVAFHRQRLQAYQTRFVLQITLVGKIISAHEAPTHLSFTIDDGTGKIELSYWTSGDDEQEAVSV